MRWSASQVTEMIAAEDAAAIMHAIVKCSFRPDSRWLSTVCCISIDRINIALQELLRTGRLRMPSATQWLVVHQRGV